MAQPTSTPDHATESVAQVESPTSGLAALGIDAPFLIAQIVNFLVLFFLLRWLLYRPILSVLAKRRSTIEESLKQAEAAKRDAESAEEQSAALLARARGEAKTIVDEAKQSAQTIAADLQAQAQQQSEQLLERTRTQLEQEKAAVLLDAERELGGLVIRATEKVLAGRGEVTEQDVAAALRDLRATSD
ncbi:F0F1 ATP synthase subunit B [Candidatus Berkelbacteria bacterium]|nr:F0F1 ATP synthase subunit B [Candidatus Berkelbacteria bacterium]